MEVAIRAAADIGVADNEVAISDRVVLSDEVELDRVAGLSGDDVRRESKSIPGPDSDLTNRTSRKDGREESKKCALREGHLRRSGGMELYDALQV